MYNEPSKKVEKRRNKPSEGDLSRGIAKIGNAAAKQIGGENAQNMEIQDPDDEPEQPQLTIFVALLTLGVSTALVAVCAEFMVSLTRSFFECGYLDTRCIDTLLCFMANGLCCIRLTPSMD